ncbi:MAG TPA: hypothetical protein ENH29_07830 [Bacteroidetes bacterium]|nr:hypothetical protein [Bacteroidota bacterium]
MNHVPGSLNTLPEKFAQLDCDSVELLFEKGKSDFFVTQKMLNALKTFKPNKVGRFLLSKGCMIRCWQ